jgi:hypothetical protein
LCIEKVTMTQFTIHLILSLTGWGYLLSREALRRLKIIEPYLVEQERMANAQLLMYGSAEANGPEFIELDKILNRFVKPSNLLQ